MNNNNINNLPIVIPNARILGKEVITYSQPHVASRSELFGANNIQVEGKKVKTDYLTTQHFHGAQSKDMSEVIRGGANVEMEFSNGDIYSGECDNGKPNGKGQMKNANGNVYDGEWKDDKLIVN